VKTSPTKEDKPRIASIDLLRGVVMLLMALDHVRDFFHFDAFIYDPTNLDLTTPIIFFTRFITHYCAPVFVFLAGTSAFFVGRRMAKKALSTWLVKRGFWLIFLEITVVKLAWYFKLNFSNIDLMVIWVLGASMIVLAGALHLPKKFIIIISLVGIAGHNFFDGLSFNNEILNNIWIVFHESAPIKIGETMFFIAYPLIPWIFVMPLGYYFGELYTGSFTPEKRKSLLLKMGFGLIAGFFVIRGINVYGDLHPWVTMDSLSYTILSFFNVHKYPPSLDYLMITLGPSFVFLAISEKWQNGIWNKISIVGKVPMFFYLIHLFVIHGLACIAAELTGFGFSSLVMDGWVTEVPELRGYGFGLSVVYFVWLAIILMLYPICKKYYGYKFANKDKWWLSYL
jgi:uncharacterized membrane protein